MKWTDIPMAAKVLGCAISGVTVGVTAAILWLFSTFVTQAQDQQQWQFHQQAVTCNRVSELRLHVERIRWELQNPEMPQSVRSAKINEIESIEKEIARLDPRGLCK